MTMEFATKPMIIASFRGLHVYAPLPRNMANTSAENMNSGRILYKCYLERDLSEDITMPCGTSRRSCTMAYIQWARAKKYHKGHVVDSKPSKGVGSSKDMLALAVRFPFELLDNFVGAWCAMFIPHAKDSEQLNQAIQRGDPVVLDRGLWPCPDAAIGTRYLKAALTAIGAPLDDQGDSHGLLPEIVKDMVLRGLPTSRIKTFVSRLRACKLLMDHIDGIADARIRRRIIDSWTLKHASRIENLVWSPEQNMVLEAVAGGVTVADANVSPHSRMLLVTGGPGTGKTSVIMQCAIAAAEAGCKVLIACPIGALVSVYRSNLPAGSEIVIETIHSSFKITRKALGQERVLLIIVVQTQRHLIPSPARTCLLFARPPADGPEGLHS